MTDATPWSAIADFYQPTLEIVKLWMWGLPLFAAIIAISFMLSGKRLRGLSWKGMIDVVFPRDLHAHPSARVDRWNAIILFVIGFPLVGLFALNGLAIASNVAGVMTGHFGAVPQLLQAGWAIVLLQFSVFFLATDFAGYWVHYWCHTNPFLWTLHKPHHTAETLTPWTLYRQHPIEFFVLNAIPAVFGGAVTGIALYATGTAMHPGTVACVGILSYVLFFLIDFLSHAHVPVSYGWLNRIVLAPVMHNIHHSMELQHRDKNNAVVLTLWDWMFGTLYLPAKNEKWRWGVNEEEYGPTNPHNTLKGFYAEPFVAVGKSVSRLLPHRARKSAGDRG
ncbi:sterol desaturase family protein [Sphingomonas sp. CL5.1]|uniref:sterol desaturase family protein n=1 Tax=Sphingomonas sp. CL5.1 TaxID=2653203 RepID=UPI0015827F68|nr:sterol desaturase family protein [Sphingomonas sp. CL5.1]QKR99587.1 sterol desaturase family protein [Sphingomonas sp. CL5.1]